MFRCKIIIQSIGYIRGCKIIYTRTSGALLVPLMLEPFKIGRTRVYASNSQAASPESGACTCTLICAFQMKRTAEVDILQTEFIRSEAADARSRRQTLEARSFLEESAAPLSSFKCQPQNKKNQQTGFVLITAEMKGSLSRPA